LIASAVPSHRAVVGQLSQPGANRGGAQAAELAQLLDGLTRQPLPRPTRARDGSSLSAAIGIVKRADLILSTTISLAVTVDHHYPRPRFKGPQGVLTPARFVALGRGFWPAKVTEMANRCAWVEHLRRYCKCERTSQANYMTSDHRVAGSSPAGCKPQHQLLTG